MARKFLGGKPTVGSTDTPVVVTTDKLSALAATTSAELAGVISDETGSGSLVFGTSPTINGQTLGTVQSTSTLGNNFSLTAGVSVLRYTGSSNATLTGISAAGGTPTDGRLLVVMNTATDSTATLSAESSSSTAAYRFGLYGSIVLAPKQAVVLIYDGTTSRWRAASPPPASTDYAGVVQLTSNLSSSATLVPTAKIVTDSINPIRNQGFLQGLALVSLADVSELGDLAVPLFSLDQWVFSVNYIGTADATLSSLRFTTPSGVLYYDPIDNCRIIRFNNASAYTVTLQHESSYASARFRLSLPDSANISLAPGQSILLAYKLDFTSTAPDWGNSRWGVLTNTPIRNSNTTATSANTASAIVARDGSGNFSAGTITAALTGTASGNVPNGRTITATSPITIAGTTSADLSADRTIAINDGTTAAKGAVQLEDSTASTSTTKAATPNSVKTAYDLANAAVPKSLVDAKGDLIGASADNTPARIGPVGANGTALVADSTATPGVAWSTSINGTAIPSSKTLVVTTDADSANTASKIVQRDGSGNFSAGTITAALTGTASGNIATTFVNAKGDLITATADNTPAILTVGSDGAFLVADADATNGVAWSGMYPVTGDVTVANSATFATATGMSGAVAAAKKYLIRGCVLFDTTAAGDFKFQFTGPASPTLVRIFCITNIPGATSLASVVQTAFSTSQSLTGTGTTGGAVQFHGVVHTSAGNSGSVAFQFAQNSQTNDSGAIVRAGSYLEIIRIA